MSKGGENVMNWDCLENGCFNHKCRPRFKVFAECFADNVNLTDVDGVVERNGKAFFLEWKSRGERKTIPSELSLGQKIMFKNLSKIDGFVAVVVFGWAQNMKITHMKKIENGVEGEWEKADIEDLKDYMKRWEFEVTQPIFTYSSEANLPF